MFYEFPKIKTLNDVLPAIQGRPEFIVAERPEYTVVNYAVMMTDSFPAVHTVEDALRRECRGLVFDKAGNLISRPLHKFFNAGERDETQVHNLDLSSGHMVLDKLDGSMLRPLFLNGQIRWGTKMGITDVAAGADAFCCSHGKLNTFARDLIFSGFTPIFEWVSPNNRIVVNYDDERMVLIAVRDTYTGRYSPMWEMQEMVKGYDIPVVNSYGGVTDIVSFMERVKGEEGIEGYVVRFENGHMVKIKCEQYLTMHKSKDISSSERKIVEAILSETIDDLKSMLVKEDLERVKKVEETFWSRVCNYSQHLDVIYEEAQLKSGGDRKEFALGYGKSLSPIEKGMIFSKWDGKKTTLDIVLDVFRKHVGGDTKYEEFKKTLK